MERKKVILVSPDGLSRRLINLWLEIRGFRPRLVEDSVACAELMLKEMPDVIMVWNAQHAHALQSAFPDEAIEYLLIVDRAGPDDDNTGLLPPSAPPIF